jgi:deoxyribose-phosphate aldolase
MDHVETTAPVVARPTYEDLASRVEVALLDPAVDEETQAARIREAAALGVAAITVRPGDVEIAARALAGSATILAAACAFPYGLAATSVKIYEARDLLRRGARRIDVAVSLAKLQSRQFQFVEMELIQLAQACHESGAKLKAVFGTPWLGEEQKLVASKIAKRSETDLAQAAFDPTPSADEAVLLAKCPPLVDVVTHAIGHAEAFAAFERGAARVVLTDWAQALPAYRQLLTAPVIT